MRGADWLVRTKSRYLITDTQGIILFRRNELR